MLIPMLVPMQVDTLCDRLAILVAGRVNAEGSPDQLKQQFGGGYKVSFKLGVKFMLKLIAQAHADKGEPEAGGRLLGGEHGEAARPHPRRPTGGEEEQLVELQVLRTLGILITSVNSST